MNIAFPAVLIILLVLPGVIFNRCRSVCGRFRTQHQLTDEIFPSLGAATVAHLLWVLGCCMLSGWTGLVVDVESVMLLVAGRLGEQPQSIDAIKSTSDHPIAVFIYFSSLLLVCCFAGHLHGYIRIKLHGKQRALMVFSAEDESQARRLAEWADALPVDIPKSGITCTTIVASLTIGSKSYLYAGLLKKVFWDEATGEPEWLQLWATIRRDITDDGSPATKTSEHWYEVEGESFMIRFSRVDTLNVIYSALDESDKPAALPPPEEASELTNAESTIPLPLSVETTLDR